MPVSRAQYLEYIKAHLSSEKKSNVPDAEEKTQALTWLVNAVAVALVGDPSKPAEKDYLDQEKLNKAKKSLITYHNQDLLRYYDRCVRSKYHEGADVTRVTPEYFLLNFLEKDSNFEFDNSNDGRKWRLSEIMSNNYVVTEVDRDGKRKQLLASIKNRMTPMEYIKINATDQRGGYINETSTYPYGHMASKKTRKLYRAIQLTQEGKGSFRENSVENLDSVDAKLQSNSIDALMLRNPRVSEACKKNDADELEKMREELEKSFSFDNLEDARKAQLAAGRTLEQMERRGDAKAAQSESWQKLKESLRSFAQPLVTVQEGLSAGARRDAEEAALKQLSSRSAQVLVGVEQFTKGRKKILSSENQACVDLALDAVAIAVPNADKNMCVQPLVDRFNQIRGKEELRVALNQYGLKTRRYVQEYAEPQEVKTHIKTLSDFIVPTGEAHGSKWRAFCSSLRDLNGLKQEDMVQANAGENRPDAPPAWTEEAKEKVNSVLDSAEKYLEGKKNVRRDPDQQLRVDLTLDVLADLAQFSDEAAMRVNRIFDRVNEVRDSDKAVDQKKFGADNMSNQRKSDAQAACDAEKNRGLGNPHDQMPILNEERNSMVL